MAPLFIDFEASSLSQNSWPIEIGFAWIDEAGKIRSEGRLIRPDPTWDLADWDPAAEDVHGIQSEELEAASPATEVARWAVARMFGTTSLISDAPAFDGHWLERLMATIGIEGEFILEDFRTATWKAFSAEGTIAPRRLHRVAKTLASLPAPHRAGEDAARLATAWRKGLT